ncbi:hypothetical protein PanWU01x14_186870 [Parasponia andersonii]|uniref:Disease resistance N-terminal domain-containing protein n=1 Tax=Parasponia andersonii TaxID=3476 RepID=A0A2P5C3N9_PARAD|nr:hypothetical protein PanWU01x14_186870 [Parasponia andersonii]
MVRVPLLAIVAPVYVIFERLYTILEQGRPSKEDDVLEEEVRILSHNLVSFVSALSVAEARRVHCTAARAWFSEFEDVYYALESLLDEWEASQLREIRFLARFALCCFPL